MLPTSRSDARQVAEIIPLTGSPDGGTLLTLLPDALSWTRAGSSFVEPGVVRGGCGGAHRALAHRDIGGGVRTGLGSRRGRRPDRLPRPRHLGRALPAGRGLLPLRVEPPRPCPVLHPGTVPSARRGQGLALGVGHRRHGVRRRRRVAARAPRRIHPRAGWGDRVAGAHRCTGRSALRSVEPMDRAHAVRTPRDSDVVGDRRGLVGAAGRGRHRVVAGPGASGVRPDGRGPRHRRGHPSRRRVAGRATSARAGRDLHGDRGRALAARADRSSHSSARKSQGDRHRTERLERTAGRRTARRGGGGRAAWARRSLG